MGLYAEGYEFLTGKEPKVVLGAIDSKAPHESAVYRVKEMSYCRAEKSL